MSVGEADAVVTYALVAWRPLAACVTAFTHALCRGPVSMKWRQGKGVPDMSRTVMGADIPALCVPGVQCVVMCKPVRDCVCATTIVGCGVLYACVCIGVCFVRSMRGYAASAWCVWALVVVQHACVCRGLCCA